MKLLPYNIFSIFLLIFLGCDKDSSDNSTEINSNQSSNSTITSNSSSSNNSELVNPNLNQSPITFEETTITFSEQDRQPSSRTTGNWGRFGGIGAINLTLEYANNPETDNENQSSKVIKVTEPSGIQSWAGFYFELEEKIVFPEGKEAISIQFYSPGPGHTVLIKLEDELPNDTPGKKTTGDLFAETIGTGWETLIFNIPELDGKNGIYNTITMILGYNISNSLKLITTLIT